MRPIKENYTPLVLAAFALTVGTLVVVQIYILNEPSRIRADEATDLARAIAVGHDLYAENCAACHGENGEGDYGPALNSRELLRMTSDETFYSLTRTGIPGTIMPAWGQAFGGPFTDQEVNHLVAFIRSWEPDAPELAADVDVPNPIRGAAIYARTCYICHGEEGGGTEKAPAINDPRRLSRLDDNWYRSTISYGRPAKGMPTWGTVLSPSQIGDLVALVAAWREGETVTADISLATYIGNALFAIRQFDRVDAEFYLTAALENVDPEQAEVIHEIIELVRENQLFLAQGRVASLLPPEEMGWALFTSSCAACHGPDGEGGMGPNLHRNAYIQSRSDEDILDLIQNGRRGTAMDGFEDMLTEEEIGNVILLLRLWQE